MHWQPGQDTTLSGRKSILQLQEMQGVQRLRALPDIFASPHLSHASRRIGSENHRARRVKAHLFAHPGYSGFGSLRICQIDHQHGVFVVLYHLA
jgi:hypothetical protein